MDSPLKSVFDQWKYKHYFNFHERRGNNIVVQCRLCLPKTKRLSTSKDSTSNLKKHLERMHQGSLGKSNRNLDPLQLKYSGDSNRKRAAEEEPSNSSTKQAKLMFSQPTQSQKRVNQLLFNFIIQTVQSFSVVEDPSFRELVEGISGGRTVMCRKTLMKNLENSYTLMKDALTDKLKTVKTVCTTTDAWTAHNRSYLGMTVHWIEEDTYQSGSAALACTRLQGRHTYDLLAENISVIHNTFGVQNKVSATVTDNGSNFVKAFKEFASEEVTEDDREDAHFIDVNTILEEDQQEEKDFFLPPHQRCAAHTLNLVATNDIGKATAEGPSRKLFRSSMAKCAALWNKAHRSSVAAEAVADLAKMQLIVPCVTRWSSEYRAIEKVVGLTEQQLVGLCDSLVVPKFLQHELAFLREYTDVLKPLATSIDLLQGENNCFLGYIIPTILSLKCRLSEKVPEVQYTAHIIDAVLKAIDRRFQPILSSHEARMAAATIPKFKFSWLAPDDREQMQRVMVREVTLLENSHSAEDHIIDSGGDSKDSNDSFFKFEAPIKASSTTAEDQVRNFLQDKDKSLSSLSHFPSISSLFIKYNTTLPSSAPVERLFSYGGHIFSPKRNRMTDQHFEQVLLLRYNRQYQSAD